MSGPVCEHDHWEVVKLGDIAAMRWRSSYPPPLPGSVFLLVEGDIPDDARVSTGNWIVVAVSWFVALCPVCEATYPTPTVTIAKSDREVA